MNKTRQLLINIVNGGMDGYWVERLHSESDNQDYYRIRHGVDNPSLLCFPEEGIRLDAIIQGLSDEEIDSLQIIDADSNSIAGWLPISLQEMICLDKWAWARDNQEGIKRYNDCLKSLGIDPDNLSFKSL